MSKNVNLLEALYQSTAYFNGEPVEVVRERMSRMRPVYSDQAEAEDAAGVGEELAERRADWHEDNLVTRY